MTWFHFPVDDDAAPAEAFASQWAKYGTEILQARSVPLDQVSEQVQAIRPKSLRTPFHCEYLANVNLRTN
jgi:hypothetical protein